MSSRAIKSAETGLERTQGANFGEEQRQQLRLELGNRMRSLRAKRGLTLDKAAQLTGLALSTIHKIENGRVSPSYENLIRIARAYDVGIERVFAAQSETEAARTRMTVTRSGKGRRVRSRSYDYEILCNALTQKQIIPIVVTVKNCAPLTPADFDAHDGEETIYVLSGRVELHVEHYEPAELKAGDCAYFDSTLKHAMRALGGDEARIFWACTHADMET